MSKNATRFFCLSTAILLCLGISAGRVGAQEGLTLKDALVSGISSNPDFGSAAYGKMVADEQLNEAKGGFLPSIDMRGDYGYEHSDDVGTRASGGESNMFRDDISLTLSQMLFDGWGTQSSVEQRTAHVNSSGHRLRAATEQVGLSIIEAYLDVLRQRQLMMIAQKNVKEHNSILKMIEDGVDAGRSTKADADQVRARLAAARANVSNAEQALRNAESGYRRVVGDVPGELQMPKMPLDALEKTIDLQIEKTLAMSPSLKASESDIDAAKADIKNSKSTFYPKVDVQMNARTGNDLGGVEGRDTSGQALLVMNWNLYRGGSDTARVREYNHREAQSRKERDRVLRELENDVRQTWSSMIAAGERAQEFEKQAQANQRVVSAYKDQFSLDRRTLLDVLDSQNELFVTNGNIVNAEFVEMFAVYRLMAIKGNLLPALGVEYPSIDKLASNKKLSSDTAAVSEDKKEK